MLLRALLGGGCSVLSARRLPQRRMRLDAVPPPDSAPAPARVDAPADAPADGFSPLPAPALRAPGGSGPLAGAGGSAGEKIAAKLAPLPLSVAPPRRPDRTC